MKKVTKKKVVSKKEFDQRSSSMKVIKKVEVDKNFKALGIIITPDILRKNFIEKCSIENKLIASQIANHLVQTHLVKSQRYNEACEIIMFYLSLTQK